MRAAMSIRFQRRVSIFPGLRLNFSASGVSATIGVRGASVTLGGRGGPMANVGIPGSGLSARFPIFQAGHGSEPAANMPTPQYSPDEQEAVNHIYDRIIQRSFPSPPEPALRTIGSAAPAQLTSPHLIELKNFLIGVRKERDEIEQSLSNHKAALLAARRNLEKLQEQVVGLRHKQQRARNSIFRGLLNWRVAKIDRKIAHLGPDISSAINAFKIEKSAVEDLELRLEETWVDGNLALPGPAQAAWDEVTSKFEAMAKSFGIWDITADREKEKGAERSIATRILDRTTVSLSEQALPFFLPDLEALVFNNANGDDLYLYPGFLVVMRTVDDFAIIDLRELEIQFDGVRFEEREKQHHDSKLVGSTWERSNKDGSRDLRYSDNRQFPVYLYAEIRFRCKTGLDESFMFSNAQAAAEFRDRLSDFENLLLR